MLYYSVLPHAVTATIGSVMEVALTVCGHRAPLGHSAVGMANVDVRSKMFDRPSPRQSLVWFGARFLTIAIDHIGPCVVG